MPVSKNQLLRVRILDYLFKGGNRRYNIDELLERVNEKMYEVTGNENGVSERTLRNDIKLMRDEPPAGFGAPIEVIDGLYYYDDPDFGIFKGLTQNEQEALRQLDDLIQSLPEENLPVLEDIKKLINRLEIAGTFTDIYSFPMLILENNPHVKGLEWLDDIYEAMENRQKLNIDYDSFLGDGDFEGTVCPYFVREYRNRWFLIGKYEGDPDAEFYTIPLDRIKKIKRLDKICLNDEEKEKVLKKFDEIIGVTYIKENPNQKIVLTFKKPANGYIKTKPLHHTQQILKDSDEETTIQIQVRQNYELWQEILKFIPNVKIIEPDDLKEKITEMLQEGLSYIK